MDELLKRECETFDEYAMRLYKNQDVYGLTNVEVASILNKINNTTYDESAYRKKYKVGYQFFDKGFDLGYQEGLAENEDIDQSVVVQQLWEEREKHYKSKRQLQDKLREYRQYLTVEARSENLIQVIRDCTDIMNVNYPLLNTYQHTNTIDDRLGVLLISDWHYGETFDDFLNVFNKDILRDRVGRLTQSTIEYCKIMNIRTLKVLNLGDLISGDIHVTTRVNNEEDTIEQILAVSEMVSQMLFEISKYVHIEYYSVTDNHSRANKNKKNHIEQESYTRIIHEWIRLRTKECVNINVNDNTINGVQDYEIGHIKIFDKDALFVHGHNDRINQVTHTLPMITKTIPICIFMGHFHHNFEKEENEIDIIGNPSLVGSGVYSKSIRRASVPRQKLVVFKHQDGEVGREATFFV